MAEATRDQRSATDPGPEANVPDPKVPVLSTAPRTLPPHPWNLTPEPTLRKQLNIGLLVGLWPRVLSAALDMLSFLSTSLGFVFPHLVLFLPNHVFYLSF